MKHFLLTALTVLVAAGCSSAPPALQEEPGTALSDGASVTQTPGPSDQPAADPTRIVIDSIKASSTLIPLGLNLDNELEPPPADQPMQAGWYAGAKKDEDGDEFKPGEVGPAVVAGHVDGLGPDGRKGYPGIFARLSEMRVGDEILVEREGAPSLVFETYAIEKHRKNQFPTDRVYGKTAEPELRLITCGGSFGTYQPGHYDDNWIVWARLKAA